jgi:hypothetical protein
MSVLGTTTTYLGNEIPGLRGTRVRIIAVLRGALRKDADHDATDAFVSDDETLARLGGVTGDDRLDVVQVRADGTPSLVHCDPRAVDLACFAHLAP